MNNSAKNRFSIQEKINAIYQGLAACASDTTIVVKENSPRGSSCIGLISLYNRHEFQQQTERKTRKVRPIIRYAFYPSIYNPSQLGSVAIYGDNMESQYAVLERHRFLFGLRILRAKIEIGRRPFIDVRFAY